MTPRQALEWGVRAVTPPIVLLALRRLLDAFGRTTSHPPAPAPAAPAPPPPAAEPPEWEYVPEGWACEVPGWDAEGVVDVYRARWPSFLRAAEGAAPLGIAHESASASEVAVDDLDAHNMVISFGYALALAAGGRDRVTMLDWGGGPGHYFVLAKALLPDSKIAYTSKDVPRLVELGRVLLPEARFATDEAVLDERYDLVLASGSLQYAHDWRETLARLGKAARRYLFVTRMPVARDAPSFVVLQRAQRYGYGTEYLGWVLNRDELLAAAAEAGLELVREFLLAAAFAAEGAPEAPTPHRGFLFRPLTAP